MGGGGGVAQLGLLRAATALALLAAVLARPACVPSAIYLLLLLVFCQGPQPPWTSAILVLLQSAAVAISSIALVALSLVLAPQNPDDNTKAPWPSTWWPDAVVAVWSLVAVALSARALLKSSGNSEAESGSSSLLAAASSAATDDAALRPDGAVDATEIGLSVAAVCLLGAACIIQPCVSAIPMQVLVLGILLAWGWGTRGASVVKWARLAERGAQLYAGVWIGAVYSVQLISNLGPPPPAHLSNDLGLHALPWWAPNGADGQCGDLYCSELAETQVFLLFAYVLWTHYLGIVDVEWLHGARASCSFVRKRRRKTRLSPSKRRDEHARGAGV